MVLIHVWVDIKGKAEWRSKTKIRNRKSTFKESKILVLVTGNIDHQTEAKIIDSIRNIDDKDTIFSIAHRLSSLKHADRIIELKKFKNL